MSTLVWTKQKPTFPGFYFLDHIEITWVVDTPTLDQL